MSDANKTPELSKTYDPSTVEGRLYAAWKDAGCFEPDPDSDAPSYTIVLPPPNVTGRLHMGHALTATIEDAMMRWHRMRGFNALWLPGTDHAGIATQVMVERKLAAQGTSRKEIGRERFLEEVWAWKNEHGGIIDTQHEALGASLDWSRYRFTMDEVSSRAVREAFVRLHEQGLIYRDYRLINWDSGSKTALSDLEVEHEDTQGSLWKLAYPVVGTNDSLIVATTRPETMLGDTAVAVHPEDERYKHLIGKEIALPLTDRTIPIVADAILVDMEFGTGAVKVTPAHDFNDFETGKRHGLELIQIIDFEGKMCAPAPDAFVGLTVKEARKAVLAELEAKGVLVGTEPHALKIGRSQRSGVVVEPLPSTQWFLNVGPLAEPALEAVRSGKTEIIPTSRTRDYYQWMENIHDWCISRQLWWGHRIPAWYCGDCDEITVALEDPTTCSKCGGTQLRQDEDVLDTWFSSGLWPLTTLGWPAEDAQLKRFYPTSLLETGWDILFFWVARMMMLGLHFGGDVPFRKIFLHSMVLGEDGQKMSKTKGNVVDPIELIQAYGADPLRFYLSTIAGQEVGIVFSRERVAGYRNFATKLWNTARFALMNLEGYEPDAYREQVLDAADVSTLALHDRWILGRCLEVCEEVDRDLQAFRLDRAAHCVYQFVWHELCDWYLELAKATLRDDEGSPARAASQGTLGTVLDLVLRLLHPFMPFITEEIWQKLPRTGDERMLMMAAFPEPADGDGDMPGPVKRGKAVMELDSVKQARSDVAHLIEIVTTARMLKAECRVPPAKKVVLMVRADNDEGKAMLGRIAEAATFVGRFERFEIVGSGQTLPRQAASDVVSGIEVVLPLEGLIDLGEEKARLGKELAKELKALTSLDKKLSNEKFVSKAPADVVAKERERRSELADAIAKHERMLARLEEG